MEASPSVNERVLRIFRESVHIAVPSTDTDLIDNGLLDSLGLVELLFSLEREFGITIELEQLDIDEFRTVERISKFVERSAG